MISLLRRQASTQLPEGLYAEIEENVYVVDAEPDRRAFRPDVGVFDTGTEVRRVRPANGDGGTAIAEPIRLTFPTEPIEEGYIEIHDIRAGDKLITVIEVLSPTNKQDLRGRAAYLAKRAAYIAANVNIVEVDLLRGGDHLIGVPFEYLDPPSQVPYKCAIRRSDSSGLQTRVDYFPIDLRHRLPRIEVPLRAGDANIILDLQQPIDAAYEEGGFGIRIDYSKPPVPPLSPDDAAWAAELVGKSV
jgi:hypothetical protein